MNYLPFHEALEDCSRLAGKVPQASCILEGDFPVIGQGKQEVEGFTNDPGLVFRGDLPVILFGDHTAAFKFINRPFARGADGTKLFRPRTQYLDAKFAWHFLQTAKLPETGYDRKTKYLESLRIPLPPLEEQRRIAAILDRAGNLGQHAKEQLFIAKNLLASLFVETIGDPLNPPHDWTTLPLAESVQAGTDVTYGIVQAGEEYPGGVPYIRTGDIVDGEIDVSALRHTNPAIARRFTRSMVRAGEIVMSIRATVGTTAVVPVCLDGANLTQGTARVAPGDNVNGVYLLQYLRMPSTQAWIQRQVKGATFREITLARLRELPVLIPPMAIQDEFAVKAKIANSVIGSSKVLLGRIENLSQSLCNQLLGRKY
jgi:type I restriction enzyme S subunit